jgi:hypothetical protein
VKRERSRPRSDTTSPQRAAREKIASLVCHPKLPPCRRSKCVPCSSTSDGQRSCL